MSTLDSRALGFHKNSTPNFEYMRDKNGEPMIFKNVEDPFFEKLKTIDISSVDSTITDDQIKEFLNDLNIDDKAIRHYRGVDGHRIRGFTMKRKRANLYFKILSMIEKIQKHAPKEILAQV